MVENTLEEASRLCALADEARRIWIDFPEAEGGMTTPEKLAEKARLRAEYDRLRAVYHAYERSLGYEPHR